MSNSAALVETHWLPNREISPFKKKDAAQEQARTRANTGKNQPNLQTESWPIRFTGQEGTLPPRAGTDPPLNLTPT